MTRSITGSRAARVVAVLVGAGLGMVLIGLAPGVGGSYAAAGAGLFGLAALTGVAKSGTS